MARSSERLIAYGFGKKEITVEGKTIKFKGKTPDAVLAEIKKQRKSFEKGNKAKEFERALENAADHEEAEVTKDQIMLLDYPEPVTSYRVVKESHHQSIEPLYYWCYNFMGDIGFPIVDKVTDLFTASEHSSFYGAAAQRLGLAQDKVGQYLATIGKMIKDMFQLVRELRWIDERLNYYTESMDREVDGKLVKGKKGAEIALKGMWVDMVDGMVGGQRTGSNMFTMAQQLQFTALPDLFFGIHPRKKEEVDKIVDEAAKDFNRQLRDVVRRKLFQYITWKESTYEEIKNRRRFTVKYLGQHYNVIKMYMNWIKPYLKHIERLSGETERLTHPALVAAFENSMVEIEIIGRIMPEGNKDTFACLMMTFEYTTKPSMQYTGDGGYHRGPIHVGSTKITWRSYAWTAEQISNYIAMRDYQDLTLLMSIDDSLRDAMESLGDDLMNYLKEAQEKIGEPEEEVKEEIEKPKFNVFEPFTALTSGIKDLGRGTKEVFKPIWPWTKEEKNGEGDADAAKGAAKKMCWVHYNIFKKANGFIAW